MEVCKTSTGVHNVEMTCGQCFGVTQLVFKKMKVFYIIKSIFSEHREQMH